MKLFGLLITKDDHAVFSDWCRSQLPLYDAVVCLDGSSADATERIAGGYLGRLVYLHESACFLPHKTDHGLRRVVHREIVRRFGTDNWVMCCHADEFCYHDPRKVAQKAAAEGCDCVAWFSLPFYPHPDELPRWAHKQTLPIQERFRHYHWDYAGSGLPWVEERLYRNGPGVCWDRETHGSTLPHGLDRPAPFHPILCHFKVPGIDPGVFEASPEASYYRGRWEGLAHRTGLPFSVTRPQDLFVSRISGYGRCDRFEGTFPHPWNMGDEYRPDGLAREELPESR